MSGTTSAAVRFEDHFGPIVPAGAKSPEGETTSATPSAVHADRLRTLVEEMRLSVAQAIHTRDVPSKVELWDAYRRARAEAVALAASATDTPGPRRLHSI